MNTAIVLCAGYGTRLKEYTDKRPKPMLLVDGRPILEYTIVHLSRLGIKNIIINLHYYPEIIKSYFKNGNNWDVKITYSYEEKPLGTAGAVKKVESLLSSENSFFVLYGDVICNENYNQLNEFHKKQDKAIGTIVVHKRSGSNSIIEMDDTNRILNFQERPISQPSSINTQWVNSGLYCFNHEILNYIPMNEYIDFPKHVFPQLVGKQLLFGYPLTKYRCAIDSIERYSLFQKDVESGAVII